MNTVTRIAFGLLSAVVLVNGSASLASAATSTLRALQIQASQTRDNGGNFDVDTARVQPELRASLITDSPIMEPGQSSRIRALVQQARNRGSVRD
ncbi:hypothetical protein [Thermostichus vulcanus]|uniref:DUF4148 domain-containing protein n=1 Tax=Thermostichus vulcanus str. 'Rupite' TaxID=2813851 RepID=A0ABT0C8F7_THEVL|nr:hypothetical protein [Thermostichus vulcanus]MCJ2542076.1 hypothetical protein [Thermostichus vulcanus str. 'Rupite']